MTPPAKYLQVAVVGLGRPGTACALALLDDVELALAGIVGRPDTKAMAPGRLQRTPVVGHLRELAARSTSRWCACRRPKPPTSCGRCCRGDFRSSSAPRSRLPRWRASTRRSTTPRGAAASSG
jgi:hypothetical protein